MRHVHFSLVPALVCCMIGGLALGQEPDDREPEPDVPEGRLPEYLQEHKRKGLPPIGDRIEFDDKHAFPPQPKGLRLSEGAKLEVKADPQPPIAELIARSREVALRDAKVRSTLGQRFAVVGGGLVWPPKGQAPDPARQLTALDFYSYSRNRAFTVLLTDRGVVSIKPERQGYQPPETREEVEAAAEIVRKDPRFSEAVRALIVRGIQAPSKTRSRHLYLMFYKAEATPAVFEATVDMTAARVVTARAVTG
jgi:hypothetical protein